MCVAKPCSGTFPPSSETGHVEVIVRRSEQLQAQGEDAEATPKPALEALEQCRLCFPGMHSQRRDFPNTPRPRPSKARLQGYLRCLVQTALLPVGVSK